MVLQEKFPSGMKIFQIPLSWFRKVTSFVNNFCGGAGINVAKPPAPSDAAPVMVSIDEEWLDEKIRSSATSLTAGVGINITGGVVSIDPDELGKGTGENSTATDTVSLTEATESGTGYPSLDSSKTWKADTTHTPLTLFCITRFYNPGGNVSARYLLGRTLTFSPNGRLLEMSAETRVYKVRTT